MNHINNFILFTESYLDNIEFEVDFTHEIVSEYVKTIFSRIKQKGHRYKFIIDDIQFTVDFIKYPPYYGNYDRGYERIYYVDSSKKFKENLGIDPRKIIIAITKVTVDFLEKVNPRSVHIESLRMEKESGSNECDRKPSKRNKINYHFLKKMLPSKWKMMRGPQEIHIYQGDELNEHEMPQYHFGVPMKYLKP
jgi:hypothetical protein